MRELSLNILDIAQNSVKANASRISISITAENNLLTISVKDNGCGMEKDFLKKVEDPFTTTRTTRKVGMGIPLFKMAAESAGGGFKISSIPKEGTETTATFLINHIDRMPLGDVGGTMASLVLTSPDRDFSLYYRVENREFIFDTAELKEFLEGIPVESPEIIAYIKKNINENIIEVNGGVSL